MGSADGKAQSPEVKSGLLLLVPIGEAGVCKLSWKQCEGVLLWAPKAPGRPPILCSRGGGADHLASLPFPSPFILCLDHLYSWPSYPLSCLPPYAGARGLDHYRPECVTNSCTLLPGPRTPFPEVQECRADGTRIVRCCSDLLHE